MPITVNAPFAFAGPEGVNSTHSGQLQNLTWMISPVPFKPAAVSGASVNVALCIIDRATAFRRRVACLGDTLKTSSLLDRNETKPMKHATRNSVDSSSLPIAPVPLYKRWSRPTR